MNTLQLLAFLKSYTTYIFQVPVKHYLSTDIVLITQKLHKKIRQGKTYFKGTAILLKKRCTIGAQNLLKKSRFFGQPSGFVRGSFDTASYQRRLIFGNASTVIRLRFG